MAHVLFIDILRDIYRFHTFSSLIIFIVISVQFEKTEFSLVKSIEHVIAKILHIASPQNSAFFEAYEKCMALFSQFHKPATV